MQITHTNVRAIKAKSPDQHEGVRDGFMPVRRLLGGVDRNGLHSLFRIQGESLCSVWQDAHRATSKETGGDKDYNSSNGFHMLIFAFTTS